MARCPSDYLRGLSRSGLTSARLARLHRSARLHEEIKTLREELWDCRSELHEIEVLLKTVEFPAPSELVQITERKARAKKRA